MPTIANAPNGQKVTPTGTEKVPISGSQYVTTQSIADLAGGGGVSYAKYYSNAAAETVTASGGQIDPLNLDTEAIDPDGIGTLASDKVTIATTGWYYVTIAIDYAFAAAITANGSFLPKINFIGSGAPSDIYRRIYCFNGQNVIDDVIILNGLVALNSGNTVQGSFDNDTNQNIDVLIYELSLLKVG